MIENNDIHAGESVSTAHPIQSQIATVCSSVEAVPADKRGQMFAEFAEAAFNRDTDALNQCIVMWAHAGYCHLNGLTAWSYCPVGIGAARN